MRRALISRKLKNKQSGEITDGGTAATPDGVLVLRYKLLNSAVCPLLQKYPVLLAVVYVDIIIKVSVEEVLQ